jgi:hypothetical protein
MTREDALKEIDRLRAALRVAASDIDHATNQWQDEDYFIEDSEKCLVRLVCFAEPYYDLHIEHLVDSAERIRLALLKTA